MLAIATKRLASWTIALALVAVVQAAIVFWQLRLSSDATRAAHAAADAAKASADALPKIERTYLFVDISLPEGFAISSQPYELFNREK